MVYAIRYCEVRTSTQGLPGSSDVCPVGRKEPPKGKGIYARMADADEIRMRVRKWIL